jgi:hypothetical protein
MFALTRNVNPDTGTGSAGAAKMARPLKFTVDYFPHDANAAEGKTLTILFNNFGHDGLSAWWLLLGRVSLTDNHVISIRNSEDFEYLSAKLHLQPERLKEILDKLATLEAIDPALYKAGFIWCQKFVDRIASVYKSRGQAVPIKPAISLPDNQVSLTDNPISLPDNTQTKLNKTKLNKTSIDVLPEWINKNTWNAFLEMRKKKRAPPTDYAIELLIKKLEGFKNQGMIPDEVLNQSITNNWTDIYPLKDVQNGKTNSANNGKILKPDEFTDPDEYFRQQRNEH